ncbi:MAG: hypothetical protein HQL35_09245 [Alphaproteobacteria bacterium]|nr:hypothetical protein [Alphaproteobacteria bacterium]
MYRKKLTLIGLMATLLIWIPAGTYYLMAPDQTGHLSTTHMDVMIGVAVSFFIFGGSGFMFGWLVDKS